MTGAGLALPLLSASGAHAADTATWDKVAQCESGGVWSAASGNGFYGGLQLTQQMWDDYGGGAYASRPDLASRAQQIAVAESILDDRGPDAWPSCAVNAGLTKDGRAPQVDPGNASTPLPDPVDRGVDPDRSWDPSGNQGENGDEPSDRPSDATPSPSASDTSGSDDASRRPDHDHGSSGSKAPGHDGDGDGASRPGDPSRTGDPSDAAGSTDATGSTDGTGSSDGAGSSDDKGSSDPDGPSDGGSRTDTSGTPHQVPPKGKHRGDVDDTDGDGGRSAGGRHASRGDDAPRTDPAADGDYTVRPGDSLSAIATAHRLPGGWPALYERNEGVIGADADLIQPGQRLDLGNAQG
ncbi:transglycosylase family protein [Streptomyces sp. NPDC048506]|uniref:transglycosylase family protein n=1 Tax=Streptomyces sp. NPDC048506 TaxID=3155028 RepID=UPI00342BE32E